MSYNDALRRYVRDQIPLGAVLDDVRVEWDEGGMETDPTYGGETHRPPMFEVIVKYHIDPQRPDRHDEHVLDLSMTFTALLRGLLEVDDR